MIIEIGDNGLRQRYEWTTFDVPSDDPIEAAYQAMRLHYKFLTDDNHTWESKDYGPGDGSEFQRRMQYSIRIFRTQPVMWPGNHFCPAGSYWFHVAYRVPGQPHIKRQGTRNE